jgi:hypothetical protein
MTPAESATYKVVPTKVRPFGKFIAGVELNNVPEPPVGGNL